MQHRRAHPSEYHCTLVTALLLDSLAIWGFCLCRTAGRGTNQWLTTLLLLSNGPRKAYPQLKNCVVCFRDTKPGALARTVSQMPRVFMIALAIMAAAASMLPFFRPPTINASFETLTVQDHPVNSGPLVNEFLLSGTVHTHLRLISQYMNLPLQCRCKALSRRTYRCHRLSFIY